MASIIAGEREDGAAGTLLARVAAEGSSSHPYLQLDRFGGTEAQRDLSDAVHHLALLYGRHPGLIDHAAEATGCTRTRLWLVQAAELFKAERFYVMRLAVAAGPVPSTPGSAESEAAVAGQRHALHMLARSERHGCALGASTALLIDWLALRPLLDRAAERFGVAPSPSGLPTPEEIAATVIDLAAEPAPLRAVSFGIDQVLAQHRGLLDLLEVRQGARRDSA